MAYYNGLVISASDAELLAALVDERARSYPMEVEAANALADLLMAARMVPNASLPANRVGMNSFVRYREEPSGTERTIAVVHPREANVAEGRVSVLSPIGRALLGREPGEIIDVDVPGVPLNVRIIAVEKSLQALADALEVTS